MTSQEILALQKKYEELKYNSPPNNWTRNFCGNFLNQSLANLEINLFKSRHLKFQSWADLNLQPTFSSYSEQFHHFVNENWFNNLQELYTTINNDEDSKNSYDYLVQCGFPSFYGFFILEFQARECFDKLKTFPADSQVTTDLFCSFFCNMHFFNNQFYILLFKEACHSIEQNIPINDQLKKIIMLCIPFLFPVQYEAIKYFYSIHQNDFYEIFSEKVLTPLLNDAQFYPYFVGTELINHLSFQDGKAKTNSSYIDSLPSLKNDLIKIIVSPDNSYDFISYIDFEHPCFDFKYQRFMSCFSYNFFFRNSNSPNDDNPIQSPKEQISKILNICDTYLATEIKKKQSPLKIKFTCFEKELNDSDEDIFVIARKIVPNNENAFIKAYYEYQIENIVLLEKEFKKMRKFFEPSNNFTRIEEYTENIQKATILSLLPLKKEQPLPNNLHYIVSNNRTVMLGQLKLSNLLDDVNIQKEINDIYEKLNQTCPISLKNFHSVIISMNNRLKLLMKQYLEKPELNAMILENYYEEFYQISELLIRLLKMLNTVLFSNQIQNNNLGLKFILLFLYIAKQSCGLENSVLFSYVIRGFYHKLEKSQDNKTPIENYLLKAICPLTKESNQ